MIDANKVSLNSIGIIYSVVLEILTTLYFIKIKIK